MIENIVESINNNIIGRLAIFGIEEARAIYDVVQEPGDHLEIGCLWGGTAILAALAKRENNVPGQVYTIDFMQGGYWVHGDPSVGFAIPTQTKVLDNINTFDVADLVTVIKASSNPLPIEKNIRPVSVLIDGGHSYEACLQDWENVNKLDPKFVLIHDYGTGKHPGVQSVVDEVILKDANWNCVKVVNTMVVMERK